MRTSILVVIGMAVLSGLGALVYQQKRSADAQEAILARQVAEEDKYKKDTDELASKLQEAREQSERALRASFE